MVNNSEQSGKLQKDGKDAYFVLAKSWSDDSYADVVASRYRYQLAFYFSMLIAFLMIVAIDCILPLQRMTPFLVNHYQDGRVVVSPIRSVKDIKNKALVESEIAHYVLNRESYDVSSYQNQIGLVHLLSTDRVSNEYIKEQSESSVNSPVKLLQKKGFRTVHLDSILFLDKVFLMSNADKKRKLQSLAQVSFTVTDHDRNTETIAKRSYTALISWRYFGVSSDPENRWRNWDGFTVTRYTRSLRNV